MEPEFHALPGEETAGIGAGIERLKLVDGEAGLLCDLRVGLAGTHRPVRREPAHTPIRQSPRARMRARAPWRRRDHDDDRRQQARERAAREIARCPAWSLGSCRELHSLCRSSSTVFASIAAHCDASAQRAPALARILRSRRNTMAEEPIPQKTSNAPRIRVALRPCRTANAPAFRRIVGSG